LNLPTQEERLSLLEQTVAEYRPVLRDVVYELTIVKGLVTDQVRSSAAVQDQLRQINQRFAEQDRRFDAIDQRLDRLEQQMSQILTLLQPPSS
jgi:septal ring factor EnvC (AmiA/AmiB activator)